jgi:hypothetical protein
MSGSGVGLVQGSHLTQASFASAAFTGQQMTQIGALVFHSTIFSEPEAFSRAARCFNLWHQLETQAFARVLLTHLGQLTGIFQVPHFGSAYHEA